jgi:hypothetical protein
VAVRFIAADTQPDHDTIATFRRENLDAFAIAFHQVLMLARELGLLTLGMVSIGGSKIDANASKIKSVRYDRATALRSRLAADIAALTAQAEAADAADGSDPQALPAEIARREVLKAKLDEACARLEAEAEAAEEQAGSRGKTPLCSTLRNSPRSWEFPFPCTNSTPTRPRSWCAGSQSTGFLTHSS